MAVITRLYHGLELILWPREQKKATRKHRDEEIGTDNAAMEVKSKTNQKEQSKSHCWVFIRFVGRETVLLEILV